MPITVSDLLQDSENANYGSVEGASALDASLDEHGFVRPICVDRDGVIVAGNQTQLAAVRAGMSKVIEVESDGDAVIVHRRRDLDLDSDDPDVRRKSRGASLADNGVSDVSRRINMAKAQQQIVSLGISAVACGYPAVVPAREWGANFAETTTPDQSQEPGAEQPKAEDKPSPGISHVYQVVLTVADEKEQRSVYEMLRGLDLSPELRTL
jgi:hypothetical protein